MALGYQTSQDLANLLLPLHTRGEVVSQTMEDKPLLKWFNSNKKTFSGGLNTVTDPVQGAYMSDNANFIQGYSQDDQLNFSQSQNALRTSATWFEHHGGLIITFTELKEDGITISDRQRETQHSEKELYVLTDLLKNRMADFLESWQRGKNRILFLDGTQATKTMAGLKSILTDTPTQGITLGLNRATYPWWYHRVSLGLAPSQQNQTLCRFFQSELRRLKQFGGKPDMAICGSDFLNALEEEVYDKGYLTQTGFQNKGATKFGMADISLLGLGTFTWDPLLDDVGEGKRCYIMDSRRLKFRPMEQEDDKFRTPERPYNYMVWLKEVTFTATMTCTQLNANGVYSIA